MNNTFILQVGISLLFVLASVVIGYLFVHRLSNPGAIPEKEIVQRWSYLLPDQSELQSELINRIEERIEAKNLPFTIRRERINNVCFSGSDSQNFLVAQLDNYTCYIGCVAIGTDLHVNWTLRRKHSTLRQFVLGRYGNNDFAKTNMVNAFASTILEATKETAENIKFEQFVKRNRGNRKMSGILGPL